MKAMLPVSSGDRVNVNVLPRPVGPVGLPESPDPLCEPQALARNISRHILRRMKHMTRQSLAILAAVSAFSVLTIAQQAPGGRGTVFPGGQMNEDGSLRPARANAGLFSQDAYTQYEL